MARLELSEILADLPGEEVGRMVAALELLERQARASARLQGNVDSLRKSDDSPVTVVDLLHQTQMQELLARQFPGDGLLGEEPRSLQEEVYEEARRLSHDEYGLTLSPQVAEVPERGARTWVMDPIDGTKGFLGKRCFAIAVGYFVGARPSFAAMAVPGGDRRRPLDVDRSLAFAVAGRGAWRCRIGGGPRRAWTRLRPSRARQGEPLRVAVSLAHGGVVATRVRRASALSVFELDSQAKYLAAAAGEIDVYLRAARDDGRPDVIWDHMPGGTMAREAGCAVRHFDGTDVEFEPAREIRFRGGLACIADPGSAWVQEALRDADVYLSGGESSRER